MTEEAAAPHDDKAAVREAKRAERVKARTESRDPAAREAARAARVAAKREERDRAKA